MWNFEFLDRPKCQFERFVRGAAIALSQILPHLTQRPEHPRPVEPLTLTMFAIIHQLFYPRNSLHSISSQLPAASGQLPAASSQLEA
jgi:hypothetical protein